VAGRNCRPPPNPSSICWFVMMCAFRFCLQPSGRGRTNTGVGKTIFLRPAAASGAMLQSRPPSLSALFSAVGLVFNGRA
jgi:hypothetical protein